MNQSSDDSVTEKTRAALASSLQPILAEEGSLSARTGVYRRNARGPASHSLQKLFEDQRRQIDHWLAQLLQYAPAVGLSIPYGVDRLTRASIATESPQVEVPAPQMIQDLLARHEGLARRLRTETAQLRDRPALNLLHRLTDFHDTAAWILRVVVRGPGPVT